MKTCDIKQFISSCIHLITVGKILQIGYLNCFSSGLKHTHNTNMFCWVSLYFSVEIFEGGKSSHAMLIF